MLIQTKRIRRWISFNENVKCSKVHMRNFFDDAVVPFAEKKFFLVRGNASWFVRSASSVWCRNCYSFSDMLQLEMPFPNRKV